MKTVYAKIQRRIQVIMVKACNSVTEDYKKDGKAFYKINPYNSIDAVTHIFCIES